MISYTQHFENGNMKTLRKNIKNLEGFYNFFSPKPIVAAEFLCKVYCGFFKGQIRLLFAIRLVDGSAQLIQTNEGSSDSLKLLQLCNVVPYETVPTAPQSSTEPAISITGEPYKLKKNELPQGSYVIGRDIPPGKYDFFVVYGHGGCLETAKYDANGNVIDETLNYYWVGLDEHEERQVIHVNCPEGYRLTISGNVILRIAKSNKVHIDL
jgi:hypothetical protein